MGRPWTVIAMEKQTGERKSFVFNSEFDKKDAIADFESQFDRMVLEAMIPGEHKDVYIRPTVDTNRKIPRHQMFSGF